MRRRWSRIRSITLGSVMNATMRISFPHRGQAKGSTSKMRLSNSAQRRLALKVRFFGGVAGEFAEELAIV